MEYREYRWEVSKGKDNIVNAVSVLASAMLPGLGRAVKGRFREGTIKFAIFLLTVISIMLVVGLVLAPLWWYVTMKEAYKLEIVD
ncbi:MAG: hypothetical protein HY544_01135 [Candidatus Diapherotrites archaeon]|uniref:Uncharacterized protein n=1 Tax=Candidatus Iainarchaeum sp. TaxID=3101447 RepID=A0A8T3YLB0_9ARCH|nr:hypothetical protein [Candidatus Diapherotrites archaeon]